VTLWLLTLALGVVVVEGVPGVTTAVTSVCSVELAVPPSLSVTVDVLLSVAAAPAETISVTDSLVPEATLPRSQTTSAGVPLVVHVPVAGVALISDRPAGS
jgi:hypothetical protein